MAMNNELTAGIMQTEVLTNTAFTTTRSEHAATGLGSVSTNSRMEELDHTQKSSQQDIFETDYDNLHLAGFTNISGQLWYNYSCQSHEVNDMFNL